MSTAGRACLTIRACEVDHRDGYALVARSATEPDREACDTPFELLELTDVDGHHAPAEPGEQVGGLRGGGGEQEEDGYKRQGSATLAPMAAGTAKPIVPSPPELIHELGRAYSTNCAAHIWCWPTPAT